MRESSTLKKAGRTVSALPSSTARYGKALIVFSVFFAIVPFITSRRYLIGLATLAMVYAMFSQSIDLISGYMGTSTLGHAGFFGFGAYVCGYCVSVLEMDHMLAIVVTIVATAFLAALFGFLTLRLWGVQFLIVNLALGMIIWGLAFKLNKLTGGETGMQGIKRPVLFGLDLSGMIPFYYFVFVVFVAMMAFLYRLVTSTFWYTILGIRQNPDRMRALGYNVLRHKFILYFISGIVAGVAGMLYCYNFQFVSPSDAHLVMSSKGQLMSLVGGSGTLLGPIIGTIIVVLLENVVSGVTERWMMVLGALYIITVMVSPKGLVGLYHKLQAWRHKQKPRNKNGETRDATVKHD